MSRHCSNRLSCLVFARALVLGTLIIRSMVLHPNVEPVPLQVVADITEEAVDAIAFCHVVAKISKASCEMYSALMVPME